MQETDLSVQILIRKEAGACRIANGCRPTTDRRWCTGCPQPHKCVDPFYFILALLKPISAIDRISPSLFAFTRIAGIKDAVLDATNVARESTEVWPATADANNHNRQYKRWTFIRSQCSIISDAEGERRLSTIL
eukprot:scaffold657_cov214-Amphora_coffeaeformis.AAC.3